MTVQSTSWKPRPRRRASRARIDLSSLTASFSLIFIISLLSVAVENGRHHGRSIDLPITNRPAPEPGALRSDALQLAISRTGSVFVSGNVSFPSEKIDAPSIPARLVSLELPGVERRVYVRADAHAKYGDVAIALDAIRDAGLSNITFIVEQRREVPPVVQP